MDFTVRQTEEDKVGGASEPKGVACVPFTSQTIERLLEADTAGVVLRLLLHSEYCLFISDAMYNFLLLSVDANWVKLKTNFK